MIPEPYVFDMTVKSKWKSGKLATMRTGVLLPHAMVGTLGAYPKPFEFLLGSASWLTSGRELQKRIVHGWMATQHSMQLKTSTKSSPSGFMAMMLESFKEINIWWCLGIPVLHKDERLWIIGYCSPASCTTDWLKECL